MKSPCSRHPASGRALAPSSSAAAEAAEQTFWSSQQMPGPQCMQQLRATRLPAPSAPLNASARHAGWGAPAWRRTGCTSDAPSLQLPPQVRRTKSQKMPRRFSLPVFVCKGFVKCNVKSKFNCLYRRLGRQPPNANSNIQTDKRANAANQTV
eukprot:3078056-Rhodomonas_salina.2